MTGKTKDTWETTDFLRAPSCCPPEVGTAHIKGVGMLVVSFSGQKKLRTHPDWSPLGV